MQLMPILSLQTMTPEHCFMAVYHLFHDCQCEVVSAVQGTAPLGFEGEHRQRLWYSLGQCSLLLRVRLACALVFQDEFD